MRNRHHEVHARSINLLLGRAAFDTAKRKDRIEYRKGAQVIERSGGGEGYPADLRLLSVRLDSSSMS
jgi:hypothetical protein